MPPHSGAPALHLQLEHTLGLLRQVRAGGSLTDALARVPEALRPGVQALGFHVMRWRGSAEAALALLVARRPAPPVDALLTCSLALLWPEDAPPYAPHALVDEAVRCAARVAPRSKGLVNAVLRSALRRWDEVQTHVRGTVEGLHNHPRWWVDRLQGDWPEQAHAVLAAGQAHPPMSLRANPRFGGLDVLSPALREAGLAWQPLQIARAALPAGGTPAPLPQAVALDRAVAVGRIPGFAHGHWSVQDAAAQLAAPLLVQGLGPPPAGRAWRVLDACCAPGGKTAHLLELADLEVLALDIDAQRLARVRENLLRLHLPWRAGGAEPAGRVECLAADAREVDRWWDGRPFDGILLDAPCSASGVVRRHPDARWLRRPSDIPTLGRLQAELLDALWPLLRPGGCLLYATCSVFKAEGSEQIDAFLQRQALSPSVLDPASPGHLLPLSDNPETDLARPASQSSEACDGFFYALLHKP